MNNYVTLDAFEGLRKNFTDMFAEVAAKRKSKYLTFCVVIARLRIF